MKRDSEGPLTDVRGDGGQRGCPTCMHWKPTEMFAVPTSDAPHHLREAERRTELMRATSALCTWQPAIIERMPTWMQKRIRGGDLTDEDDGKDCPAWYPRASGTTDLGKEDLS